MDENETIQIGLDEILRVRHSRSAEMGQRARELRDAARRIEFLRSAEQVVREVKREAGPRNPECENILFGSPETRRQFMEQSMPAARDCQSALENAAKDYESLEAQFKRNTVSLAVVGRMGCGKSRFLQSVSGLDDFYIPSGNGPSCTGTTCIIENVDNDETRVFLSFKNRVMTLKDINAEIARFWKQFAQQGDAPKLETLDQNELRRIYDQLDSAAQNRGLEHKQRQEWEQSKEIYINQWDKWTPLVRPDEEEKELWVKRVQAQYDLIYVQYEGDIWFELGNHSRIREFAAKFSAAHEGNDNLEAHSYHVATDKLLIQKRFQGIQANHLRLIDTVGIDDPAGETAIRLEKAMDVSESDGIIYIDKYTDGRSPSSYEYETLSTTLKERQEKNPQAGYTMGLLINIASAHPHQDLWAVNYFLPDAPSASDVWKLLVEELGEQEATRINNVVAAPFKQDMDTIRQSSPDLFADNGIQATCAANPVEQRVRIVDFLNQILYNIKEHPGDENRIDAAGQAAEQAMASLEKLSVDMRSIQRRLSSASMQQGAPANFVARYMLPKLSALDKELGSYCYSLSEDKLMTPLETNLEKIERLVDRQSVEGYSVGEIARECAEKYPLNKARRNLRAMDKLYLHVRHIADAIPENYETTESQHKTFVARKFQERLGIDLEKLGDGPWGAADHDFFRKMANLLVDSDAEELSDFFASFDEFHLNDSSTIAKSIIHHAAAQKLFRTVGVVKSRGFFANLKPGAPTHENSNPTGAFRMNLEGDKDDSFDLPAQTLQDASVDDKRNPEEDRDALYDQRERETADLEESMLACLSDLLSDVRTNYCNRDGREKYAVRATEQLREEIMNFTMALDEYYWPRWLFVFELFYNKKAILNDEMEMEEKLAVWQERLLLEIQHYLGE